jgi:hypothetical protein
MENSIVIVQVPQSEWNDLKNQMQTISKSLLELNGKNKAEFLTPKECCELLKCSRNTFQNYIDKGFLEPIKVKSEKYSKIIVKRVDVDFLIQSKN